MSEMTPREHALRVAVLDVLGKEVAGAYKGARGDAEAAFGPARADGQSQQKVMLPDGTEIGLVVIKAGGKQVDVPEASLEAWAAERVPDAIEEYVNERDANSAEVLDVLRAVFPDLIRKRIRSATRAALLKEIEDTGGYLVDKETAEKVKVGEVTDLKPTGAFSYRPGKDAGDQVIAAWQRGELRHLGLGALALPGAGADPAATLTAEGLFRDENGFFGPEEAARHAMLVRGGFTTPPVEAYRMVSDGGMGAFRAQAWMEKHGLDPADPREGKDTPWPLPGAGAPDE